jgi:hypothetical protein
MSNPVVVVFAHNSKPSELELVSLKQCWDILRSHPVHLMCPLGMDTNIYKAVAPGIKVDYVPSRHFDSLVAYNRLKISPFLYKYYDKYDFILTYELDSFVFRDELSVWCEKDYDYVGAPWFEGYDQASVDAKVLSGGNSGFSLRKISTCQRVLKSMIAIESYSEIFKKWRRIENKSIGSLFLLGKWMVFRSTFNPVLNFYTGNEDVFWSVYASNRFKWFKVAPFEDASSFSFEVLPERLFSQNSNQLPFGCHKWHKYSPTFWKPHIEKFGHSVKF